MLTDHLYHICFSQISSVMSSGMESNSSVSAGVIPSRSFPPERDRQIVTLAGVRLTDITILWDIQDCSVAELLPEGDPGVRGLESNRLYHCAHKGRL